VLVCAEGGRSAPLGGGAAHRIQWTAESASGAESKPTSKCSHAAAPLPQADPVLVCDSTGERILGRVSRATEHPTRQSIPRDAGFGACTLTNLSQGASMDRSSLHERVTRPRKLRRVPAASTRHSHVGPVGLRPEAQSQSDRVAASTGLLPLGPSPTAGLLALLAATPDAACCDVGHCSVGQPHFPA
jgi:hypothetical protein